jgi:hypothetical protein
MQQLPNFTATVSLVPPSRFYASFSLPELGHASLALPALPKNRLTGDPQLHCSPHCGTCISDASSSTGCTQTCFKANCEDYDQPCHGCPNPCAGGTICGGICKDTTSDPSNCGQCGVHCSAGQSCCAGSCINTQSDPHNCGSCGRTCPSGTICQGGACVCPSGFTDCNGTCVNLSSDSSNCGSCGNRCSGGQTCSSGGCVSSSSSCTTVCQSETVVLDCEGNVTPFFSYDDCVNSLTCQLEGDCCCDEVTLQGPCHQQCCTTFSGQCTGAGGSAKCITAGGTTQCCHSNWLYGWWPEITVCNDGTRSQGCHGPCY